jgi:hypothetical protein
LHLGCYGTKPKESFSKTVGEGEKKNGEETDSLDVFTAHQAELREHSVGKKGKALLKNKIEVLNSNKIHLPTPRNECLCISY